MAGIILVRLRATYRERRKQIPDFWLALEDALAPRAGRVLARLLVGEPKILCAPAIAILRRRRQEPGSFTYKSGSQMGIVFSVVLGLVLLEGMVTSVLVPWTWLKLALGMVSAYAAFWVVGIWASLRAYPHRVGSHGLLVRYGVLADAWVPWGELRDIRVASARVPGGLEGLVNHGSTASFGVGGRTSVRVTLTSPRYVTGFLRRHGGVRTIEFWADDPASLVTAAQAMASQSAAR
jgi:hypothetical protein